MTIAGADAQPRRAESGVIARWWPRVATRAGVALALPPLVAWLAGALGYYPTIARISRPFDFLAVGPFPLEANVVTFLVFVVLAVPLTWSRDARRIVMGVGIGALLWTGFVFSRLNWARLFSDFDFLTRPEPTLGAWGAGAALLSCAILFVAVETHLDAAQARRERGLEARDVDAALRQSMGLTLVALTGAIVVAVGLGVGFFALRDALAGRVSGVNPVIAFVVLGIMLAAFIGLSAKE